MQNKDLATARSRKGLTQEEAAKRVGITQSGLSRYECGNRKPNKERLSKLMSIYSISDDDG